MLPLSDPQRQLLDEDALRPVQIIDDETKRVYYVISSDLFEQIRPLIPDTTFELRELAPQLAKTATAAGWDDPVMAAYDHFDDRHPTS